MHAALAYYYENRERIDVDIQEGQEFVEQMRAKAGPSRLRELLKAGNANGTDDSI